MDELTSKAIGATINSVTRPMPLEVFDDWLAYPVWIALSTGIVITLTHEGIELVEQTDQAKEALSSMSDAIGQSILEVVVSDEWPCVGLRLSDGKVIGWDVDLANREVYPCLLQVTDAPLTPPAPAAPSSHSRSSR